MFNFYTFYVFSIISTVWFILSNVLIQVPDLYYNFSDLHTRLWLNEFFFNMYYFYWTSFWYLVVVVVITKLVFTLVYVRRLTINLFVFISLISLYATTICEYCGYNWNHIYLLKPEYQINSLLSNSINKYHPLIFYFTLTWVYVTTIYVGVESSKTSFMSICKKHYLIKNLGYFTPLIYFTLGLGSWWALQEGSWGGWWNWDSSEVFGLLVMLFYLHLTHKRLKILNNRGLKTWGNSYTCLLVIVYLLIQLNFDLVSHNFGTKISQFINSDQLFYILLLYTTTKVCRITYAFTQNTNDFTDLSKAKNFLVKNFIFTFLVITVILLSFTELINNFLWLLLKVNIINILNLVTYYTPLTLVTLYLLLSQTNTILLTIFSYLTLSLESLYFLCISVSNPTKIYNLHIIVYLFILITYTYVNQSLIDWSYSVGNTYTSANQSLFDLYASFIKINTSYIEIASVNLINNQAASSGWNFLQWSTNQQVHTFQHSISPTLAFQGLYNSLFDYIHSIRVIEYTSQVLAFITFLWLFILWKTRNHTTVILF